MQQVTKTQLQDLLKEYGLASDNEMIEAEKLAQNQGIPFGDALVKNNVISEKHLAQLLADQWKIPFVDLKAMTIDEKAIGRLPEAMARTQELLVFREDKEKVHVAMVDPFDLPVRRILEKKFDKEVAFHVVARGDLSEALKLYHPSVGEELDLVISGYISQLKSSSDEEIEMPIVKITDTILRYAASNNASDIHIEPAENLGLIRFRIDGLLQDVLELPKLIMPAIVSRIKILSRLRIDDHFSAQDGRFSFAFDNQKVDVRVSVIPITEGEKIVMRILMDASRRLSLEDLGVSSGNLTRIKGVLKRSHGMVLSTGPTGSGKTTTLYAIIQLINKRTINISTIEDPVEYDIAGINQIQVNPKTNLTFAQGLRSLIRQDPDVIMVGEIRDPDTAGIAINAAMTGHLVLSTLHANDAATTIPRLMDLKVQPFLIASSVNVVISQRLLRRICRRCIYSVELSPKEIAVISKQIPVRDLMKGTSTKKLRVYRGHGCSICGHTGYSGRTGIFEIMIVDEKIRALVMEQKDSDIIKKAAVAGGMSTMLDDGFEKVVNGITTPEEVMRVMSEGVV